MDDLLDEIGLGAATTSGGRRCPSCSASMAPQAMVCVNCSYNVQTGRRMVEAGTDPLAASAVDQTEETLRKAEADLRKSPMQQTEGGYGEGGMAYAIAGIALVVAAAIVGGGIWFVSEATKGNAWTTAAEGGRWLGLILALASYGEIIYRAFRQYGPLHGGLSIIPIYGYIFAIIKSPYFLRPLFFYLVSLNLLALAGSLWQVGEIVNLASIADRDIDIPFSLIVYLTLLQVQTVGLTVFWWGSFGVTGNAFEEKVGGITHGTFSLVVPLYAVVYGFYRGEKPYTRSAAFGVGGISLVIAGHIGALIVIVSSMD